MQANQGRNVPDFFPHGKFALSGSMTRIVDPEFQTVV
jgi:hypothetical protein